MDHRDAHSKLLKLAQLGNVNSFMLFIQTYFNESSNWGALRHEKSGNTVACVAAEFGHVQILSLCRDDDLERANSDGKRPLHIAAQAGHIECVNYLLSRHVDVDCFKRADWTPLMLACTKDNLEVIRKLVNAGASLKLVNKDGWNCFHIAAREGNQAVIEFLLDVMPSVWMTVSQNGRTPLHTAALHGKLSVIQTLLTRCQYEVDVTDCCGTTPLMDALRSGHIDVGRLLLQRGANIHCRDNVGRKSLHLAAQANSVTSIIFLINECGADVNDPATNTFDTPLHVCAKEGHTEAISALLSLKADASLRNTKSRTALDVATAAGHTSCVLLLSRHVTT